MTRRVPADVAESHIYRPGVRQIEYGRGAMQATHRAEQPRIGGGCRRRLLVRQVGFQLGLAVAAATEEAGHAVLQRRRHGKALAGEFAPRCLNGVEPLVGLEGFVDAPH